VKRKRHTIGEIVPSPALGDAPPYKGGPLKGKKGRAKHVRASLGASHREADFYRKELIQPR